MKKKKIDLTSPTLFAVLNLVDLISTIVATSLGAQELNALFYVLGPILFFALKIVITQAVCILGHQGIIQPKIMKILNIGIGLIACWTTIIAIISAVIYLSIIL